MDSAKFYIDNGKIEDIAEYRSPEELYQELLDRIRKYHPSSDISMIEEAYNIAKNAHEGQVRKSGEPYIIHPLCVAIILAELELDKETIVSGLLHDVVEDTILTQEDVKEKFGEDVALIVDGVTKLQSLQINHDFQAKTDRLHEHEHAGEHEKEHDKEKLSDEKLEMQAENLRKMFLAMAKDIRVIMIKLADRLHNMRTLKHMTPEKQQRIARETLDIYAPIADRLGISRIKVELDDLCLKYLEPEVYYDLVDKIAIRKSVREQYIQRIVDEVTEHMNNAGLYGKIDGRIKHFFSIYKKMKNQNKSLEQIYDLFAVRIILDTVKDCYAALGVIHEMYKPIPGRFKDYIAMPKANRYQSLHTTVIGSNGHPFEIQIRTYEMHKAADYGIAAHWKYKEASDGKKVGKEQEEEKLVWLRQILEWQREMSDNREFMDLLKSDLDLFSDSVYCFTPTGDVKNLPAGSTPIDFAYCIHTAVGNRMIGARANGKLVTIDYQINNGDVIDIITSQNSKGPSRDWLNIAKSTQAKTKINQWFKNELKDENIIRGKEMLTNYCKQKGIETGKIMKPAYMEQVMRKYGFHDWDSVLAAVGHGGLKEGQIVNKMLELAEHEHKKNITDEEVLAELEDNAKIRHPAIHRTNGIVVKGIDDVAVRFSKCCSPVPGDEIVGFVTRGRGISIHRTDCENLMSFSDIERARLIDAEWQADYEMAEEKYISEISVYANNRSGLLADIARAFTEQGVDISSVNTRTNKQGIATLTICFETGGREEMSRTIDKVRQVPGVIEIERR